MSETITPIEQLALGCARLCLSEELALIVKRSTKEHGSGSHCDPVRGVNDWEGWILFLAAIVMFIVTIAFFGAIGVGSVSAVKWAYDWLA